MPLPRPRLLFDLPKENSTPLSIDELFLEIENFSEFGKETSVLEFPDKRFDIPVYLNEFWTSRQRAAHSLHEISYRACFKPQLPRFFITRLTTEGDVVYDPFMGRGTTLIEAALLGRVPYGCDINPLSEILVRPRFAPPTASQVAERLSQIDLETPCETWNDLLVFYHPVTLRAITNLRNYLLERERNGELDNVDRWIRMVATNRLTGHSTGFFSVYTLPPNQATFIDSQKKINEKRNQTPPERDVRTIIVKKTKSLLRTLRHDERARLREAGQRAHLLCASCDETPEIEDGDVRLVVTSPPFLNIVNYKMDNWLRCWFNGFDANAVKIWQFPNPSAWRARMTGVLRELRRVLAPGGFVAFEVGEVRKGKILLEELIVPAGAEAGLKPLLVLVNSQKFTKTSNCWGVDNLKKGTNTNRIVLFQKDDAPA